MVLLYKVCTCINKYKVRCTCTCPAGVPVYQAQVPLLNTNTRYQYRAGCTAGTGDFLSKHSYRVKWRGVGRVQTIKI